MTTAVSTLRELIAAELPELITIRHDLHAHPELMFQEQRTSGVVQRELAALGIDHKPGLAGGTGVLAHLPATEDNNRPAVALRADMDALPIAETTGKPYASANPGVMHACGHDGHTTILLGAARILSKLDKRPNPITFVFQPAEEGGAGGQKMCDDGALQGAGAGGLGNPVGRIFGLHAWPTLPLGVISTRPGPLLAATDEFHITIEGSQAHAAYPHQGHDPILAAAHVITALQSIASRNVGPLDSVVVTVGQINAGTANNVIPATATLDGTVRTLLPETRALARDRFHAIATAAAEALGCRARIEFHEGYPVTSNDPALARHTLDTAIDAFGRDRVHLAEHPTMGGEDFSFYGLHVPACFFFLGIKPEGRPAYPALHQPDFDFNDDAIPTGVEMFCRLALAD